MRKNIYTRIRVYHFSIHQKLTQHCKSTQLQQQKKPKRTVGTEKLECV